MIGRDLILKNTGWVVGNGESINIWEAPWLSLEEKRRPMGPPPLAQLNMKVVHLLQPNRQDWNIEEIRRVLPQEEETILSLKPSKTGAPNKLIWLGTTSGEYTTRSGYKTALKEQNANLEDPLATDINWVRYIWKIETAPKVKLFLWKVFCAALPVGSNLAARNITNSTLCNLCNTTESTNHLFLQCNFAQKVWSLAPFSQSVDVRGLVDLASCWHSLCTLECLPPSGVSGQLAPWILWGIWLARNNLIFNNKQSSPEEVISSAISAAREWLSEQVKTPTLTPTPLPRETRPPHTTVVYSDAAWQADRRTAGLGWTIREDNSTTQRMSHCYFVASPLVAEGLALREAMTDYVARDTRRLHCNTDSLILFNALKSGTPIAELYGILADIISLSSAFEHFSISWIRRTYNKEADALAKQALLNASVVPAPYRA
ncbi:PREDICTED: uncharacterized protein LOC106298091 [Brassica oleracea var. oleracea]|uniref:uncharacterized protein LOC106298091 n=1 Tax=Brassica oleracea var. oleracea TaxID=109376 RepID=UPI0006A731B6|nr:PREDICTED: uncharacterized protein LOC106298091 [Brassica oleracea var. oleracea]